MRLKVSNKIERIYTIILYLNIVLLNIFVGSTHEASKTILQTAIIVELIIYLILSKKKNILIRGKIDIAVTLMVFVTSIPLVFETYSSLSDTIDIFTEYLTVYSMYIMARNLLNTPERKNTFINIILISSTIIVIFGIDRSNFNIFQKFYDITNSSQVEDTRMVSTLGYSNAVFAYIVSLMFIAIGRFLEIDNKKISSIYAMYVQLAMYAFYYCNSRAGMVIFVLVFIAYLLSLKDVKKIIQSIIITVFSYLVVFVIDKLNLFQISSIAIFLVILLTLIITYILSIILSNIKLKIKPKNSKKSIAIAIILIIVISILYIAIAQNFSTPCEMKSGYDYQTLFRLKTNTEYKLKVDYTLESNEPITIQLLQSDNKRNNTILYKNTLNKSGKNLTEEFSIKTGDVDYAMLEFYTPEDSKLIFNKIYIDGKEEVVNYKYLPHELMRLIQTMNIKNISISERISMYRSGLKLFTLHPIVGNGANTYENMYIMVREYAYATMEVHSYYLDILMDYGIIGIIVCLTMILITIVNFTKKEKNILSKSIFCGWMFVVIHTTVDFDLAYLLTLSNFFLMMALISEEDKNITNISIWSERGISAIIILMILINFIRIPGEKLSKEGKYKEAMAYIPYSKSNTLQYIKKEPSTDSMEKNVNVIIRYLSKEKDINQFGVIKKLEKMSIFLIENGDIEQGTKGLNKIISMIKNDEILIKKDIVDKNKWEEFEKQMKAEVKALNLSYKDEKIKKIYNMLKDV